MLHWQYGTLTPALLSFLLRSGMDATAGATYVASCNQAADDHQVPVYLSEVHIDKSTGKVDKDTGEGYRLAFQAEKPSNGGIITHAQCTCKH